MEPTYSQILRFVIIGTEEQKVGGGNKRWDSRDRRKGLRGSPSEAGDHAASTLGPMLPRGRNLWEEKVHV